MIHIGFTGTSGQLTDVQMVKFEDVVKDLPHQFIFHHGDCVGADTFADAICSLDERCERIYVHPPENPKQRSYCGDKLVSRHVILEERAYLDRNHDIVDAADALIAMPNTMSEVLRSGTWATIRYAKKKNKKILIIWPNGQITNI